MKKPKNLLHFTNSILRWIYLVPITKIVLALTPHVPGLFARYKNLLEAFQGDKCVVVGTGPSLEVRDIVALKSLGYKIIGVNSVARLVSEGSLSHLDLYVIQDYQVYERLELDILNHLPVDCTVLVGSNIWYKRPFLQNIKVVYFPFNILSHYGSDFNTPYTTRFDDNVFSVFDGYTVVYSAIQLAYYLGFQHIGLLGIDAGYSKNVSERNIMDIGKIDPTYTTAGDRINFSLSFADRFLRSKGIEMFNFTRGGNLLNITRVKINNEG